MRAKRSFYNIAAAIGAQGVILLLGLIIPRLTLTNYGSETNGYMSMVGQIYSYIGLLEAGLLTAEVQALYGPVAANDRRAISSVVNAARAYYRRIAACYAAIVLALSVVVPLFVAAGSLSRLEMGLYFLLFGVSNVVNFCFTASMRPLLLAEGKNYVNSNIELAFHFFSQAAKIWLLSSGVGIVTLQLAYTSINVLQIGVYYTYFRKSYDWLDKSAPADNGAIRQREAFLGQQISNLIFSSTDVVLLSFFCDLKVASVYAVYMLIFNTLSILQSSVSRGTQFVLGQEYNRNRENYVSVHRAYECAFLTFAFILFTAAAVLTIPFIKLYTAGVTDIDYVDPVLPVLLSVNALLATSKSTSLCLINISFHARQTLGRTMAEAGINLGLSLLLIPLYGIRGALIGTMVALLYRLFDTMWYVSRRILNTSMLPAAKLCFSNFAMFALLLFVGGRVRISIGNYAQFVLSGIAAVGICCAVYVPLNYLLNRSVLSGPLRHLMVQVRGKCGNE